MFPGREAGKAGKNLLRPHAIDDYSERSFWTTARRVWEHVHSLLGFATLALAAVNCVLGIIILSNRFLEVDFSNWFNGFSATIIFVMVIIAFIGRYHAALQDERIFYLSAGNHHSVEGNGRDHGVVESPSGTDEAYKKV